MEDYQAVKPTKSEDRRLASLRRLLDDPNIKALMDHACNTALGSLLGQPVREIVQYCLLTPPRYEIVSLSNGNDQKLLPAEQMHYLIYSYIVNRASAIAIFEADGYLPRDGLLAKTDSAFVHVVNTLMKHEQLQVKRIDGSTRTVLELEGEAIEGAYRVLELPMKFKVQRQEAVGSGLAPVELAIFWFTPAQNGAWDTAWDYISRSYAVCFHGDEKYEF